MLAVLYKVIAIKARARLARDREAAALDEIHSYEALLREEARLWGGADAHIHWSTNGSAVRVSFVVGGIEYVAEGSGLSRGQAILAALRRLRAERWGKDDAENRPDEGSVVQPDHEGWRMVLGLGPDADRKAVERAYRSLAKRHHPDRGGDAEAMGRINLAREEARIALGF